MHHHCVRCDGFEDVLAVDPALVLAFLGTCRSVRVCCAAVDGRCAGAFVTEAWRIYASRMQDAESSRAGGNPYEEEGVRQTFCNAFAMDLIWPDASELAASLLPFGPWTVSATAPTLLSRTFVTATTAERSGNVLFLDTFPYHEEHEKFSLQTTMVDTIKTHADYLFVFEPMAEWLRCRQVFATLVRKFPSQQPGKWTYDNSHFLLLSREAAGAERFG